MKRSLRMTMVLLLGLGALASCTVNYYGLDQNQTNYPKRGQYPTRHPDTRPPYHPPVGGETGGIRQPPTGGGTGGVKTPPAGWETGGIKQPVRVNPVGIKPPAGGGETGGIKPPPAGGGTGGIKTPPNNWETGGIKSPPASGGSVSIKPPVETNSGGIKTPPNNWETGGIKTPPTGGGGVSIKPPVDTDKDDIKTPPNEWQTGGIKYPPSGGGSVGVKPPTEGESGGIKQPPIENETGGIKSPPAWETGGIKSPLGGLESNGGKETADTEFSGPLVTFTKTPCLGPCPDFTASIWADGRVTYIGKQNVAKIGTYQLQLPATTVSEFLREAQKIDFPGFKNHYTSGTSDLPSTILTIRQADGSSKTVQAEEDIPGALLDLFAHINGELDSLVGNPADTAK